MGGKSLMDARPAEPVDLSQVGTNALIRALWLRGDLGLAWLTFERRHRKITDACDDLRTLGVPDDVLEPALSFVRKPSAAEALDV